MTPNQILAVIVVVGLLSWFVVEMCFGGGDRRKGGGGGWDGTGWGE